MLVKRNFISFSVQDNALFQNKLLFWAEKNFPVHCLLDSNEIEAGQYSDFPAIFAAGDFNSVVIDSNKKNAFKKLKIFSDAINDWIFGFFSYDLKNQTENLSSNNSDGINMPLMYFFQPIVLVIFEKHSFKIGILENQNYTAENIFNEINNQILPEKLSYNKPQINSRVSKKEYVDNIKKIKNHIQKGDIYEMNYCFEFFSDNAIIDPVSSYNKLKKISPAPFAAFLKYNNKYLLCSSPERFLKKKQEKLISQPIKGTIKRGETDKEDALLSSQLFNDPKERSENVMIVDLVRNDLSKSAIKNSVQVEELCGIYKFAKVQQMISTVTAVMDQKMHYTDAIKYAFPMGSMTGAPKVKAMELAEKYETTKRGLYSGAIGYIDPEKNFDFNVIIRSILFCQKNNYLSFMVGSAITIGSDPDKEYSECLLKAKSMAEVFDMFF
ncbi:MAG: anthranilate synthase component I family protein [Bacteroidota bacterium]